MSQALVGQTSAKRAAARPHVQVWAKETGDRLSELNDAFADWVKVIRKNEELFQRHVYENDSPGQLDFRQHRQSLYAMLAAGEALAVEFTLLGAAEVALIDQKLAALRHVLHEWHGPVSDPAIPESFRQGMREAGEQAGLQTLDSLIGEEQGA